MDQIVGFHEVPMEESPMLTEAKLMVDHLTLQAIFQDAPQDPGMAPASTNPTAACSGTRFANAPWHAKASQAAPLPKAARASCATKKRGRVSSATRGARGASSATSGDANTR